MISKLAELTTGIVEIGKYLISQTNKIVEKIATWRKVKRQDEVDRAISNHDSKRLRDIVRNIKAKRDKRSKQS